MTSLHKLNDDETSEPAESPIGEIRTKSASAIGKRAYLLAGMAVVALTELTTLTDTGISSSPSHSVG